MNEPGRNCPLHYRYAPRDLAAAPELEAETLYVVGGLYGNGPALDAVLAMREAEAGAVTLVFNGDFNWFNVDAKAFSRINARVLEHAATRGNVETELAAPSDGAGCGCAYPQWIEDDVVKRSNTILGRLRRTADAFPDLRRRLGELPMFRCARVGGTRIGIVHGDAESLSGWGFSQEALGAPGGLDGLERRFAEARVRVFAGSHTCLPVCLGLESGFGPLAVINNGAAGMPNFGGTRFGLITRISTRPARDPAPLYGTRVERAYVDALPVRYDHEAWCEAFRANWPSGSPAREGYFQRITDGPRFSLDQAVRGAAGVCVSTDATAPVAAASSRAALSGG